MRASGGGGAPPPTAKGTSLAGGGEGGAEGGWGEGEGGPRRRRRGSRGKKKREAAQSNAMVQPPSHKLNSKDTIAQTKLQGRALSATSRGGGWLFYFGELSLIKTRPFRLIPTSGLNFMTVPTAVPLFWKSFRRYRCITES